MAMSVPAGRLNTSTTEGTYCFGPRRAARANLIETKTTSLNTSGGEMSAKRLAVLVVLVLGLSTLVSSAWAQKNELSITAGRTFVSTETIVNDPFGAGDFDPHIHFGNPASFEFDYARLLKTHKIFGLYAEVPVQIFPRMYLHWDQNPIPRDIGALFVTPSVRLNIFSGDSVTPWVSVGGGYGRFWASSNRIFYGPNPGQTGT